MREILFRGFCQHVGGKETILLDGKAIIGDWIIGWYGKFVLSCGWNLVDAIVSQEDAGEGKWEAQRVIPETIGQFTGLCDKNGKKIFEGDRIIAHEEDGDCQYSIRYKADQDYPAFDCDPYIDCDSNGLSYLFGSGISIEVIGTIFDVKEEAK